MPEPMDVWRPRLNAQLEYYRARASEYDEWFLRQGRYDRGADENARWRREADEVRESLIAGHPGGDVLELASGTGIWSQELLPKARSLTVVDGAEEMLAIHADRIRDPRIRRIHADLFAWSPEQRYDFVAFGFWLSHVPSELFASFFATVARCLVPGGRFFFVDSRYAESSTARDHQLSPADAEVQTRRLNDGRSFEIVKRFPSAAELSQDLEELGWETQIETTETYFLYGWGHRRAASGSPTSLAEDDGPHLGPTP